MPERDFDHESKTVKPSLFEKASENGMSVTRVNLEEMDGIARQQAEGGFLGFVTALCRDVRASLHENKRLFCVYDTATESE